jgi:hypothetical protein
VQKEKRKEWLTTPTLYGYGSLSIYIYIYVFIKPIIHSWQKKRKKKNLYCCFVHLVDTREKRQISGNKFFLSRSILLLHRNVDDDDDAILKSKKKTTEKRKRKVYENKLNSDEHEWPFFIRERHANCANGARMKYVTPSVSFRNRQITIISKTIIIIIIQHRLLPRHV